MNTPVYITKTEPLNYAPSGSRVFYSDGESSLILDKHSDALKRWLNKGETVIYNARIESARLSLDRGVFLCAWLYMDFDMGTQGFGGNVLFNTSKKDRPQDDNAFAARYITGVMEAVGVEEWGELAGKYCRIERKNDWNSPILAVGHIVKDKWFRPDDLRALCFPEEAAS